MLIILFANTQAHVIQNGSGSTHWAMPDSAYSVLEKTWSFVPSTAQESLGEEELENRILELEGNL